MSIIGIAVESLMSLKQQFSLMKACLIVVHLFEAKPGLCGENKLSVSVFLSVANGMFVSFLPQLNPDIADRYSLLPAISMQGIFYACVMEGSFTAVLFYEFIQGLLDQMDQ